ncbi:MAG TPA: nitrilase-related carbon-nitrogen hydrolase, partial [Longimicrobium sp.]|nr:nitrilase-related carbon-nitrogen hydrolase [Longimicrobium sp.]
MRAPFHSIYSHGFIRAAVCIPAVRVADPAFNLEHTLRLARQASDAHAAVALFPELGVSAYTCEDLFQQDALLDAVQEALGRLVRESVGMTPILLVGAPLRLGGHTFNCAVVVYRGRILGIVPKSYLPNYREFYERRWFAPGDDRELEWATLAGHDVRFGPDLIFRCLDVPGLDLHVEVCEDMWVPVPPSAEAALAGATVLANLSGSPITIARAEDRRLLVRSASSRCAAAYVYAAAGQGESSTDLSWDGQTMVYECGSLLGESERFPDGPRRTVVDVDLDLIRQERLRQGSFDDNRR